MSQLPKVLAQMVSEIILNELLRQKKLGNLAYLFITIFHLEIFAFNSLKTRPFPAYLQTRNAQCPRGFQPYWGYFLSLDTA